MKYVDKQTQNYQPRITDKRGGVGHVPAEHTPEPEAHPPTTPPPRESVPAGEREGAAGAPLSEDVIVAIKEVDFLGQGDRFIVRDVTYQVVSVLAAQNALLIQPVEIGRATRKQMRKASREAK